MQASTISKEMGKSLAIVAGTFILDILTPRGYAEWLLYLLPFLLYGARLSRRQSRLLLITCFLLLGAGFVGSAPGVPAVVAFINRICIAVFLVLIAQLVQSRKEAGECLAETKDLLSTQAAMKSQLEQQCLELEREIDQRRLVEESLRLSEAQFRNLSEALPHLIWVTTADGTVEYVNARWCEYMGKERTEGSIQWPHDILHQEDRERTYGKWRESLSSGEVFETEHRLKSVEGNFRWYRRGRCRSVA